jgi:hypothetical protein
MAIKFNRSQTFATNGIVTASGLHNLVDGLDIYQALITDQTELTNVSTDDNILVADASLTAGDAPRKATVQNIFDDALTGGTFTNAQFSGAVTSGTTNSTRGVFANSTITTGTIPSLTSSTASITIGTIPTLTAGTTTSTAANITNGTIQTLTSSTATITGGTFSGAINSTSGTVANLTSSTTTISDIATGKNFAINVGTLATASGTQDLDFTSQGYLTHLITGNITYTASNYSAGKSLTVRITSDGTARNLTFPTNWTFIGAKPTSIAAGKIAILSITSFGTTEANTVAAYAVQT